ncbi:TPA: hypothetical protein R1P52_004085, partial [Acinetobacter baumannii]|nr:hypothetical protein [Acinetobacter baumannii]EIB6920610.1 hypothetical protein [Acinetobacter baumannii]EIB6997720.1 hypothetical protein [Acinetobacter baumannii]EIB7039396.1 hypothetical protein [Acinetobacter baumannii]EIB7212678.1 hypothetical protein [Acinetobacter baumannii]
TKSSSLERNELLRNNLNTLHDLVEGKISFNQYKKESSDDRIAYKKRLEEEQKRQEKLAQEYMHN